MLSRAFGRRFNIRFLATKTDFKSVYFCHWPV